MSCDSCNIPSDAIIYSGPNLLCIDVDKRESTTVAIQKAEQTLCELQTAVNTLQKQINVLVPTTTTTSTIRKYNIFIKVKETAPTGVILQIPTLGIYTNIGSPTSYILVASNISFGTNVTIYLGIFGEGISPQYGVGQNGAYTGQCGASPYSPSVTSDIYLNVNTVSGNYVSC